MADFTVKTTGFVELEKAWLELSNDLGPKKARTVANVPLKRAMAPITSEIEARTPVETGELKNSIFFNSGIPSKKELRGGAVTRNDVAIGRTGWGWQRGDSKWFQALAVEYGTRHQAPQSILRNALMNNYNEALTILGRELGNNIEKRAARLARTGR